DDLVLVEDREQELREDDGDGERHDLKERLASSLEHPTAANRRSLDGVELAARIEQGGHCAAPAPCGKTARSRSSRANNSSARPSKRISPFSMKYACSTRLSAMLTDCSTRTTAVPSALICRTMSSSWPTITGARPSDSSSMRSNRGRSINALD